MLNGLATGKLIHLGNLIYLFVGLVEETVNFVGTDIFNNLAQA